ncbi:HAD family hydrolase [Advenella kashmirensis W13003]|uniref:D,D-heptose 1,7-bisphosphate phosphatase n=1 Tax=Advenella kashmirensis W13003 TaxID=1424334 RepID=V8QUM7_9BURK|nr:HAD family hydrolase [Advenella kashmirensis]ETF03641.1 HAD family hydrolase [Advenella kashmirensis W13003]
MALKSAIFLDKDGTLLKDIPYNVDPNKMEFAPGAKEGLARIAQLALPIFVITNQPGIALEKFCLDDIEDMETKLRQMFLEAGAELAGLYFCPHHPDGSLLQYTCECMCRKPEPGLLLEAAKQHDIALSESWFIGDILNDIEAGRRAGCRTILIDNGNETEWVLNALRTPHYRARDMEIASRILVDECQMLDEAYS